VAELKRQIAFLSAENQRFERAVAEAKVENQQKTAELAKGVAERSGEKLLWESVTNVAGSWRECVHELTACLGSVDILVRVYELLNWNGQCGHLGLWQGRATMDRM
jgi:hypothetical protein